MTSALSRWFWTGTHAAWASEPSPVYLEDGSWAGSTACSAAGNHPHAVTPCIHNKSEFGGPQEIFDENISRAMRDHGGLAQSLAPYRPCRKPLFWLSTISNGSRSGPELGAQHLNKNSKSYGALRGGLLHVAMQLIGTLRNSVVITDFFGRCDTGLRTPEFGVAQERG